MAKKSFFKTRTPEQITKLDTSLVTTPLNLVSLIESINPLNQAIILDGGSVGLEHPDYQDSDDLTYNGRRAMRGAKRQGDRKSYPSYISLIQPRSVEQALAERKLPLRIREEAFAAQSRKPEKDLFKVGYLRFPITGLNKAPILTPFWSIMAGAKLDAYNGRVLAKLPVGFNPSMGSFVEREYGPVVFVKVPSATAGKRKYTQRWENVATRNNDERKVLAWNTRPFYGHFQDDVFVASLDDLPENQAWGFSHAGSQSDGSVQDFVGINPHCVAGHQTLLRYFMRKGNFVPLERSQVAIPSREDASYWNKLENNVLMRYVIDEKEVFRPLRIDQKSMLMTRRVAQYASVTTPNQISRTMYWDVERDGRISDYPWLPGEK